MPEKDVSLSIGGEPEGLDAALARAKQIVRGAVTDMERNLGSLQSAFSRVQGVIVAMTAVLGGGAAFKAAVDATVNLSKESEILGRQLGIGATQASVLKIALDDVFATEEQVSAATGKISQTLNTNESAFSRLGVATRDQNGNFRNSLDILLDVNGRLAQLKEGTDRNVAGVQIFGRSWSTVEPLIKLNADAMADAATKGRELGLVLGTEDVEATDRYRKAMSDVGDVLLAMQKTIGDALLPILTRMATWFSETGPFAIRVLKVAIAEVQTVLIGLRTAFVLTAETMAAGLAQLTTLFGTFGRVASALIRGDFAGAKAAWEGGFAELDAIGAAWRERLVAEQERAASDVADIWEGALKPPATTDIRRPDGGGTSEASGDRGKDKGRMSEWAAELAEAKVAWQEKQRLEGSFREFSKQQELEYWQGILATQNANQAEQISVRAKIAQLALAIDQARFAAELEILKGEEASYRANGEARLEVTREIAERMREAYGEESKEYAAARADVVAAERQVQQQLEQARMTQAESAGTQALLAIDAEEEALRERLSLQEITESEMLAAQRAFEEQRNEIRRQGMEAALAIALQDPDRDPVKIAQLQAQIQELERAHQLKLGEIRRRELRASVADWQGALGSIEGGFSRSMASMVKGQMSFAQGAQSMAAAVVGSMIDMIVNVASQFLVSQIAQLAGIKATGLSTITAHAGEAAAGAYAATAPIPIVGPALAPGAAAAAFTGAMAYTAALSAARGYDIPAGINPVTQLHQSEMVLPEELANVVRSVAGEGGTGRRQPVNVNVTTVDSRGFRRLIDRNSGALADAMMKALRGSRLR